MTLEQLRGARVLVIGASGFVGGRIAERLALECRAQVRVLTRRVMGAARLARLPIDVRLGDVLDPATLLQAADGCSVVINCAKGAGPDPAHRRAVDVEGTRHVVEAAAASRARVVHISTMVVYELPSHGTFDETAPDAPRGDSYSENKLAGERLALEAGARAGVPVTVLQPSVVYGPYAAVHAADILAELRSARVALINGGNGVCNAVYVDDVVSAVLLAAVSPNAPGERFLISGPEYPTWADFYHGFERMLGVERTVPMSEADALTLWERTRPRWLAAEALDAVRHDPKLRTRLLRTREGELISRVARRLLSPRRRERIRSAPDAPVPLREPPLPIGAMRPWVVRYLARRARVNIAKARRLLGYDPVFALDEGLRLTEAWARWSGLA